MEIFATLDSMYKIIKSLTILAEVTTTELHKTNDSQGMKELMTDAHDGGEFVSITRQNIEDKIGRPVVTSENANSLKYNNNIEIE